MIIFVDRSQFVEAVRVMKVGEILQFDCSSISYDVDTPDWLMGLFNGSGTETVERLFYDVERYGDAFPKLKAKTPDSIVDLKEGDVVYKSPDGDVKIIDKDEFHKKFKSFIIDSREKL